MNYNILIADDFDMNRNLIKMILKGKIEGLNFYEAENGLQTLKIISETDVDLVILDLVMPEKDGFTVLKELKATPKFKEIPVIVNSSLEDMDSIKEALEHGALDYFTKPLSKVEMEITMPLKVKNALKYYEQNKLITSINKQMTDELIFAGTFQLSLMEGFKAFQKADMYGKCISSNKVGGDFYECAQIRDTLWFIIADVCGHGVVSSMVASMIKIIFTQLIQNLSTPGSLLEQINNTFCKILGSENNLFFSAFVGCIDENKLCYSNAGHYYPLLYENEGSSLKFLEQNGMPIGIMKETGYPNSFETVSPGDSIITYTDGIFDTGKTAERWGSDEVYEYSRQNIELLQHDPRGFIDTLIKSFEKDSEDDRRDDATLMVIKVK